MIGLSERLKELIKNKGVTPYEVSVSTGINQSTLSRILNNNTQKMSIKNTLLLAKYFEVDKDWLVTGVQEREKDNKTTPYHINKSGIEYYQLANGKYRMRVPFVPIHAYAKYIDEHRDADYWAEDCFYEFLVDNIHHGNYKAFEIKGDSMDDDSKRSLSNGDVVLARELSSELWKSRLHTNEYPNWIIVLEDTILCKQIIEQDIEKCEITCHSLNSSREYADFKVSLNEVVQLFNIVQRVSTSF